jgi:hypothetical protein
MMSPSILVAIIPLLLGPVCAIVAGIVVWIITRGEEAQDGKLLGGFMTVFLMMLLISWQAMRSDAVRLRLDPAFKLQKELEAHRLYSAIKELAPDDGVKLSGFLAKQIVNGATLPQGFVQARPLLIEMLRSRVGFADQKTNIAWAQYHLANYKRFARRNADLCYALIGRHPIDPQTVTAAFDADDERDFEDLAVTIYQAADRGMRHEYPPGDKPADFNATGREYSAIQEQVESAFGKEIATMIRKREFPADTALSHGEICRARIFQFEQMLERPQAQAAMLTRSVLY